MKLQKHITIIALSTLFSLGNSFGMQRDSGSTNQASAYIQTGRGVLISIAGALAHYLFSSYSLNASESGNEVYLNPTDINNEGRMLLEVMVKDPNIPEETIIAVIKTLSDEEIDTIKGFYNILDLAQKRDQDKGSNIHEALLQRAYSTTDEKDKEGGVKRKYNDKKSESERNKRYKVYPNTEELNEEETQMALDYPIEDETEEREEDEEENAVEIPGVLADLPRELWTEIMEYLSPEDRNSLGSTSSNLRRLLNEYRSTSLLGGNQPLNLRNEATLEKFTKVLVHFSQLYKDSQIKEPIEITRPVFLKSVKDLKNLAKVNAPSFRVIHIRSDFNDLHSGEPVQNISNTLQSFINLTNVSIVLMNCQISNTGVVALANELRGLPNLTNVSIDLRDNNINNEGVAALAEMLRILRNLTNISIDLRANNISDEGAATLANALRSLPNLTNVVIELGDNNISDEAAEMFRNLPNIARLMINLENIPN